MDEKRFIQLFDHYYSRKATKPEQDEWLMMLHSGQYDELLRGLIDQYYGQFIAARSPLSAGRERQLLKEILAADGHDVDASMITAPTYKHYKWISAAAVLLVALAIAMYFYKGDRQQEETLPGGNRATLTLTDGTRVALDSAQNGIVISNENIKYTNGRSVKGETAKPLLASLTLSTPKGMVYQVILSDGTKVWLNTASTLKYPSSFPADKREVELDEGEAYFQVAPPRSSGATRAPFIVKSRNQETTVLGTEFNISAFADEKETKTTLIEGKVQIRSESAARSTYAVQVLIPGQQAINTNGEIQLKTVKVMNEIAWRNNQFNFHEESLENMMRKLSHWYNIEVVYQDENQRKSRFDAIIDRSSSLTEVLRVLELAGDARFRIQGRKVIVY